MFRECHGDVGVDGTGVAGEIADPRQTTAPGPAAWPRAITSRRLGPSRTKPNTSPLTDRARRATWARAPASTWPTAGPLPVPAATLRPVPVRVVTTHAWLFGVATECAAAANNSGWP